MVRRTVIEHEMGFCGAILLGKTPTGGPGKAIIISLIVAEDLYVFRFWKFPPDKTYRPM